jgi:hypothetical protein
VPTLVPYAVEDHTVQEHGDRVAPVVELIDLDLLAEVRVRARIPQLVPSPVAFLDLLGYVG